MKFFPYWWNNLIIILGARVVLGVDNNIVCLIRFFAVLTYQKINKDSLQFSFIDKGRRLQGWTYRLFRITVAFRSCETTLSLAVVGETIGYFLSKTSRIVVIGLLIYLCWMLNYQVNSIYSFSIMDLVWWEKHWLIMHSLWY